jgi:hypothetical protein
LARIAHAGRPVECGKAVVVLPIVHREDGATEFFQKKDISFASLFKASEFLNG